jgi:DNA polymerase III epsilon subunit-like protein
MIQMILNADLRDKLKLTRPLVCVDVETHDKCPPEKAYIVEIGLIVFYPDGRPRKEWGTIVRPPEGIKVHPCATAVHGIEHAECFKRNAEGEYVYPSFKQIGVNLAQGTANCDFCGYNGGFDLRAIAAEMKRNGILWSYEDAHLLDPLAIWRKKSARTLTDAVREHARREPTDAHRALADISDTVDAMMGMFVNTDWDLPNTVKACADLCKNEDNIDDAGKFSWKGEVPIINFGKWSGTPLTDPSLRGYLQWMLNGDFTPSTKKVCIDALAGTFPKKASV